MIPRHFDAPPEKELESMLKDAVPLAERDSGDYTAYLFQIDGSYIEVYCHQLNSALSYCRSFDSLAELGPYLENMPVYF